MGSSKYVTLEEAARILNVCIRTVRRYKNIRVLTTVKLPGYGKRDFILESDLTAIKKGQREILKSPLKRDIIANLMVEIQTLKTQMATVMRILNVRYDPLSFTAPEYDHLYKSAKQMSEEGWSPHVEEMWTDYLIRLKIEDLEKIERVTEDPHPWRPFLRLVSTMHVAPWDASLTDSLAAARNNIQQLSGLWCVLKDESPTTLDVLTQRDTAPVRKIIKMMLKTKNAKLPANTSPFER